jgi:hypothetical protein
MTKEEESRVQQLIDTAEPYFVLDPNTGKTLRLWGYGVLKHVMKVREDIDWTAPILRSGIRRKGPAQRTG